MIPIGVAVVWLSYTTGVWGYCLVRGYNVQFRQLFSATWPGPGKAQGISTTATKATIAAGQPGGVFQIGHSPPTPSGDFPATTQLTGQ